MATLQGLRMGFCKICQMPAKRIVSRFIVLFSRRLGAPAATNIIFYRWLLKLPMLRSLGKKLGASFARPQWLSVRCVHVASSERVVELLEGGEGGAWWCVAVGQVCLVLCGF